MANTTSTGGEESALNLEMKVTPSNPIPAIKKRFRPYLDVPKALFGSKQIQKYLVQRVRNRFKAEGTSKIAQTAPNGVAWPRLADSTIARGRDTRRKLFETGALSRSIVVIKDTLNNALYTNTGAGFRIGVKATGRNFKGRSPGEYARIQNEGGWSGRNNASWIPARRYLGIGPDDKKAMDTWLVRFMKKQGI